MIEIDIKDLKIVFDQRQQESLKVYILWTRGKKTFTTKYKELVDNFATFDEQFQINTVMNISKKTGGPVKEK